MKVHAVITRMTIAFGCHTSSGTRDAVKSKINQELLRTFLDGALVQNQCFDRNRDIFFGDVNFDATDVNILQRFVSGH